MALVPYNDTLLPALSKLHESSAEFDLANHRIRISQNWNQFGVAAVVWDAVSFYLIILVFILILTREAEANKEGNGWIAAFCS